MNIIQPSVTILNPLTQMPMTQEEAKNIMKHIERCGRVCYKSEDLITDDSAERFIRSIVKSGHESVLEHFSLSVLFTVDRGVTHEMVRHRIASYSQESTRYCNYSKGKFGGEISVVDIWDGMNLDKSMGGLSHLEFAAIYKEWEAACRDAESHYMKMLELGASPQIARSVLPNSTKADIVMTSNFREWRHFCSLRGSKAAHPQIREVTLPLTTALYELFPPIFEDIVQKVGNE